MEILNILLEITIYSGILFCAIMLLKLCFKNRMSPLLHFAIWGLLIARLLIPVTLESSIHLFVIPEGTDSEIVQQTQVSEGTEPILDTNTSNSGQTKPQANAGGHTQSAAISSAITENTATTRQAVSLSTEEILLAIWLTGAIISVLYLVILYGVLRRRIQKNVQPPSKYLLKLFDEVKAELNIKRDVKIMGQCEYGTPAILFPNIVLMPVSTAVSLSDDEVKFVLRHELMHFKRRDHITGLLLSFLTAVYWFNPIIWLAFKQIHADMETACDSDVVRHFSGREKTAYAGVILSLFSGKRYGNLALSMARGDTRQIAEKRIRGIFMNRKTNKNVKIMAILLVIMLSITCFTTACQPTPEQQAVVNKNEGVLESAIAATPAPVPSEQTIIENQWVETYTIQNLVCEFNTQITLPQTNMYPVYKVEQGSFEPDFVDKLIKYFTIGATGVRKTSLTKEELEQQLIQVKRGRYIVDDSGGRWETYEGQEQDIANLEKQIQNAVPETFNDISNEPVTLPVDNTYLMSDGSKVYIQAGNNFVEFSTDKYAGITTESTIILGGTMPGEPAGTTLQNVKISEEEACVKVNSFLTDLGIENLGIAQTEKARMNSEYTPDEISEGWKITVTRDDGNSVPVDLMSVQGSGLLDFGSEDYAERWQPETMTLFIDETGIRYLSWVSPLEIVEEMNENVMLQQFEDIKERIRKNIEFGYSQSVENGVVQGDHHLMINKIVLTNVLVPIKDELDYQMLVPAWLVYFNDVTEDSNMTYVFAVNAIDGSSIDFTLRQLAPNINP